ncbi:MAG: hypothetical protein DSM106950_22595 [Stigonema ocellatum SAG 48.90 = DSM 106950]|nr:hypothetical protein [Stigonema ocellatum SAG 48.90 = DSM 106950]
MLLSWAAASRFQVLLLPTSDRILWQQPKNEAGQDFEFNKPTIHMMVNV